MFFKQKPPKNRHGLVNKVGKLEWATKFRFLRRNFKNLIQPTAEDVI